MINIAIDGPAGAGKSTIAKSVSKILNYIYLDTGAMYRAAAYFALKNNFDISNSEDVAKAMAMIEMDIKFNEVGEQQIFVCGENATPFLREHHMSKAASDISAHSSVRFKLVDLQRDFAKSNNVVLDGRDIGTFVLPNANLKIFLTASVEERAKRRYIELTEKGQSIDFEALKKDIETRDYNDSHREVAPLKQADDAVLLDTTNMGIDDVVEYVCNAVKTI